MKVLVLGGTRFVGRAFVELAVGHGHEVAVFHRSVSEPDDFPSVEHLHGDRDGQLGLLRGRSWDAVLDTCGYVPRVVREATAVLRDVAGHYTLVSTLSVHPDDMPAGATERAALHQPPFPQTETVTDQTYGPLKVACEYAATTAFGDRCLIIRPGYIVGPHDPSDRFTFYVRRAAAGGEMAAPGPPDAPVQVIDVRDLAAFMLGRIEAAAGGVFGVVGPGEPIVMRDVLATARDAAAAHTTFTWLSQEFLEAAGDQAQQWFPLWEPQFPGVHTYDAAKAVAAGLRCRPLADTRGRHPGLGPAARPARSAHRPERRNGNRTPHHLALATLTAQLPPIVTSGELGRWSEFYLMVGDSIVVPFQAVASDVWQVQLAGADLERAGQYRVGPVLPFQPVRGRRDAQQVARDLRIQMG